MLGGCGSAIGLVGFGVALIGTRLIRLNGSHEPNRRDGTHIRCLSSRRSGLGRHRCLIPGDTMIHRFRISRGPDVGELVDTIQDAEAIARDHGPGRYDVDEHSVDQFPGTKVSARSWGKVIHHRDGQVVLDPIPWPS